MSRKITSVLLGLIISMLGYSQVQVDLPVTFDNPSVNYNLVDFGGNISSIVVDPVNPANNVAKIIKPNYAELWAGTTIGGTTGGFANWIAFAPGATIVTMKVYSPDAGIPVRMKVEDPADPTKSVETEAVTTVAGEWQTLQFNFANQASGTAAINYSYIYKKMSVFFNFGTTGANAGEKTYYFDDVQFNASGAQLSNADLTVTFNHTDINYGLIDFGGNISSIILDPVSPSNRVAKVIKTSGAELWAGTTVGGASGLVNAIPFTPGATTLTMRVYSPDAGIPVRMKVEDPADPTKSVETEVLTTSANAWQTLNFNFANNAPGTAGINYSYTYKKLSVFFNFGVTGATAGEKTYYFDDIAFGPAAPTSITVTFQVQNPPLSPVYVFGSWSGWGNWPGNPMTSSGGGYYTTSMTFTPGTSHEFLFVNGSTPAKEILNPAWSCTNGNPVYTNRVMTLGYADTTICFQWALCTSCVAPIFQQVDLPVTFDNSLVNYDLVDFGGNASSVVDDPVVPTNKVCKIIKSNTAELWAGTTIGGTSGLATQIPFAAGSTKISIRVYSPDAGIPIRVKTEVLNDPGKSVETEKLTTVANAWETLEFNFANQVAGTQPINFSYAYKKLSIFFNFGTNGAAAGTKTYYFDDVLFVPGAPVFINVTLNVQNPPGLPVYAFGSWSGWGNWPGNEMTSVGNGFYSTTLSFPANSNHEFLFVSGSSPVKEVLNPAWACTNGNPVYTNRILSLGSTDTSLCLNWASCNTCVVPYVPPVLNLGNTVVGSEQGECYNATQTITAGGSGNTFIVEAFGEVTMIAGQKISLLPGVKVKANGYFHGFIAQNEQYCAVTVAPAVKSAENPGESVITKENITMQIFPNPVTSDMTIKINGLKENERSDYQILNIRGSVLYQDVIIGNTSTTCRLDKLSPGIYFLKAVCGNQIITEKIIKR